MPRHDCRDDRTGRSRKLYFDVIAPSKFNIGDKVFVAHPEIKNLREATVTAIMRHQNNNLIPLISYSLKETLGSSVMRVDEEISEDYVFATELEALKVLTKEILPCEHRHLLWQLRVTRSSEKHYAARIKELEKEARQKKRSNEHPKNKRALSR